MTTQQVHFQTVQKTVDLSSLLDPNGKIPGGIKTATVQVKAGGQAGFDDDDDQELRDLEEQGPQVGGSAAPNPAFSVFFSATGSSGGKIPHSALEAGRLTAIEAEVEKTSSSNIFRDPFACLRADNDGVVSAIKRVKGVDSVVLCYVGSDKKVEIPVPKDSELLVESDQKFVKGTPIFSGPKVGAGRPMIIVPIDWKPQRFYDGPTGKVICSSIDGVRPKTPPQWSNGQANYACATCPHKARPCRYSCSFYFIGGDSLDRLYRIILRGNNYSNFFSRKLFSLFRATQKIYRYTLLVDTMEADISYVEQGQKKTKKSWVMEVVDVGNTPVSLKDDLVGAFKDVRKYHVSEAKRQTQMASRYSAPVNSVQAPSTTPEWGAPQVNTNSFEGVNPEEEWNENAENPPF